MSVAGRIYMKRTVSFLLLGLSFFGVSSSLVAADKTYCQSYARALINLPHKNKSTLAVCQQDQPHWSTDKAKHLEWCLGVKQAEADKKLYQHNKLVNLCNDTYKIVMIDRQRSATPPVSVNDPIEMTPAPGALKDALFKNKPLKSPYATLYPSIQKAIKDGTINQCDIHSLTVNLDKNQQSNEWVVSIDASCLAEKKRGHIWLVQQLGDNYHILFEGEDDTFTLRYTETNTFKNITIAAQLHPDEETDKRCGGIIADWHYKDGRYLPVKGQADEHGSCLPEYNLPDRLQGANTYDLAEGEWEKEMLDEEKKRKALFAPYKKALTDYIPEWIGKIEKLVPANPKAVITHNQLYTKDDSDHKSTKKNQEQEKEDKSFMQNVRSFLGIE